jgi:hypothetical protein
MNQAKTTEPKSPSPVAVSSGVFVSTLAALKGGSFLVSADDALRELTSKVQKQQLKGKLTITLEIVPNGSGVGDVPLLKVVPDISVASPKPKAKGETFFADEDSNLTRRHPGQAEMKLTLVNVRDEPKAEASTAAPKAVSQ